MLTLVLLLQSYPRIKHSEHPFWTSFLLPTPHPPAFIHSSVDRYLFSFQPYLINALFPWSLYTALNYQNTTAQILEWKTFCFILKISSGETKKYKKQSLMWWVELLNICCFFFTRSIVPMDSNPSFVYLGISQTLSYIMLCSGLFTRDRINCNTFRSAIWMVKILIPSCMSNNWTKKLGCIARK